MMDREVSLDVCPGQLLYAAGKVREKTKHSNEIIVGMIKGIYNDICTFVI